MPFPPETAFLSRYNPVRFVLGQYSVKNRLLAAKARFPQKGKCLSKINHPGAGGKIEDAQSSHNGKSFSAGKGYACTLIHQDKIGVKLFRKDNGLKLAFVKRGSTWFSRSLHFRSRTNLQPRWRSCNPLPDFGWRFLAIKFRSDDRRYKYRAKKPRQYLYGLDQNQVMQWPRIRDNNLHATSKSEALNGGDLLLNLFHRIRLIDLMGLENGIQRCPRLKAQQPA